MVTYRLARGVLHPAPAADIGRRLVGRWRATSAALAPGPEPSTFGAGRLAQVDRAAVVLPEHRDQVSRLPGDPVDDGADEPHLPDGRGRGIDERGGGAAQQLKQLFTSRGACAGPLSTAARPIRRAEQSLRHRCQVLTCGL